ncbi:hypothetical protein AABB24_032154, partial [Solanum stoloniferum]
RRLVPRRPPEGVKNAPARFLFSGDALQITAATTSLLLPFHLPTRFTPFRSPANQSLDAVCKVFERGVTVGPRLIVQKWDFGLINSGRYFCTTGKAGEGETSNGSGNDVVAESSGEFKEDKIKRKKLKGKRQVVKWLKFFRWKKKKEFQRMTAEERILFKLRKARKKEERLVEALRKVEPKEISEATHDPEILTPEEHFYFLKMGEKCKNYVPVGRRGIYQGVILNMHLHWKKHQTLKVVVKTFSPEEVKEIAVELARLSGGIVLDIQDDDTIIMYRGKNYSQPPTEIMSPRSTLSRKKALDKSKYRDSLRAVERYIPRLEQDLELLRLQAENETDAPNKNQEVGLEKFHPEHRSDQQIEASDKLKRIMVENEEQGEENDSMVDTDICSDSEDLSDIFETDSEEEREEKAEEPLYLDVFEMFPVQSNGDAQDFEEHLRQISSNSRKEKSPGKDVDTPGLDEVDKIILQAASLLKKRKR